MRIPLRNKWWADARDVRAIRMILEDLFSGRYGMDGVLAVDWAVRYARDRRTDLLKMITAQHMDLLRSFGMTTAGNDFDPEILDILDACIDGSGVDMVLVDPADPSPPASGWEHGRPPVRYPVSRIADALGFGPARRLKFRQDGCFEPNEALALRRWAARSLALDPQIIDVELCPHLHGDPEDPYVTLAPPYDTFPGDPGLRLVLGGPRKE